MLRRMKQHTHAEHVLGFRIHAAAFVAIVLLLIAINLWKGSPYWVQWVVLSWGIGLASHWWWGVGPGARRAAL
jgi:hypothetical protein